MKTLIGTSEHNSNTGKETPSPSPPEHPVIKPAVNPEKEKNIPFHPVPEIQPSHQPEIKPVKRDEDHNT